MSSFAYADPPYLGQSKRLYGDHPDYAGEVDHKELIDRLESDYDGWALSASMKSIPTLARLLPVDVLTLSWVKRTAPPLGDHRHYSWEPVFLRAVRRPGPGYVMSHLDCIPPGNTYTFRPTPESHVIGAKPEKFCHWVFAAAGLMPSDTFHDLFPGSGAVQRAWETWTLDQVASNLASVEVSEESCESCQ